NRHQQLKWQHQRTDRQKHESAAKAHGSAEGGSHKAGQQDNEGAWVGQGHGSGQIAKRPAIIRMGSQSTPRVQAGIMPSLSGAPQKYVRQLPTRPASDSRQPRGGSARFAGRAAAEISAGAAGAGGVSGAEQRYRTVAQ